MIRRAFDRVLRGIRAQAAWVRVGAQYLIDASAWVVAVILALWVRYDFDLEPVRWGSILLILVFVVLVQFPAGWVMHLYRGRHPYGSFDEVLSLAGSVILVSVFVGLPVVFLGGVLEVPRSMMAFAAPLAFLFMGSVRYLKRALSDRVSAQGDNALPTLIYGAGYLGSTIVRRMVTDRQMPYRPVGLIDDSPMRKRAWIDGVRVLGTGRDLERVASQTGATVLVVAIAKADSTLLREISDSARRAGLVVKVFPSLEEILEGKSRVRDIRDISIEDLIGRNPVDTEVESIAGYLEGRRVLVTGAGGSIGSELCRQIAKFNPGELIMLDHDETSLQHTQISLRGNGLLDTREVVLASIRDEAAIKAVFAERRPEVVFHAAALKHLPMLEQYPEEAWKSNVLGTLNVLNASLDSNVETFVNISTDKAANPTSVLGHSKRVAEKLTAWAAEVSGHRYLSVRFGNVIGSRGSMLPTFRSLIDSGGPLTITHPDVTRFFMTIAEACQLVVQAGGIGQPREVLILDMGSPVRILDIAQRMIDMSGRDIAIVYTGLRPGEKLHEELIGEGESDTRPVHPKISHAFAQSLDPDRLDFSEWISRIVETEAAP